MDRFTNALNSFSGGQQSQNQQAGEGQPQRPTNAASFLQGAMNNFSGNTQQQQPTSEQQSQTSGSSSFLSGLKNQLNTAAGGGPESEKNEDYLDKGVDFVQERFLGQGPQNNESAIEQAKDEQISDFIRDQYKSATGKDFFVKDKPTKF